MKRSLFDDLLLRRARELGANVHEQTTVTGLSRNGHWNIETASGDFFQARILIGADGRNSTVAHLCNLLPRPARERVALQAHIPLPRDFGNRIVLQFLREGYSGQASVNETQLNLCLVGTPPTISKLRQWAERQFQLPADQGWRTITPLTRSPVPSAHENLFFVGDAARVVEPFTGEGIYYALRSGELAANAIAKILRGDDRQLSVARISLALTPKCIVDVYGLIASHARRSCGRNSGRCSFTPREFVPAIMKLLTAKIVCRQVVIPSGAKRSRGIPRTNRTINAAGSRDFARDDGSERLPRRFHRVRHQHRNRHWPNAAWHGCNRACLF